MDHIYLYKPFYLWMVFTHTRWYSWWTPFTSCNMIRYVLLAMMIKTIGSVSESPDDDPVVLSPPPFFLASTWKVNNPRSKIVSILATTMLMNKWLWLKGPSSIKLVLWQHWTAEPFPALLVHTLFFHNLNFLLHVQFVTWGLFLYSANSSILFDRD